MKTGIVKANYCMSSAKKAAPSFKGESPGGFFGGGESPKDRRDEERQRAEERQRLERTPSSDRLETENAELRRKLADLEVRQTAKTKQPTVVDAGLEALREKVAKGRRLLEEASLKQELKTLEKKLGRRIK